MSLINNLNDSIQRGKLVEKGREEKKMIVDGRALEYSVCS
jgi:hypothetical protein